MSTRRAKQLIYGAFYTLFWILFFTVVYFLFRFLAPSAPMQEECTNNCMPVGASSISTSTLWSFVTSPGHYTFLDQIVNTNADYAAEYFDYTINLYDSSGTVLQSIPEASFIYADQTKYLVVPNQIVTADTVAAASIIISNVDWVPENTLGVVPQFNLQNIEAATASTTVSVGGQLTNSDISTLKYVFVDVIFKDSDSNPIGASQTEINNVGPGQTVNFSVIYPATSTINPASNQILIYGIRD